MEKNSYFIEESSIRIERFFRKYKTLFITIIIIALLAFAANFINNILKNNKLNESNALYLELLSDENAIQNQAKLNELYKLNKNLYLAVLLQKNNVEQISKLNLNEFDELLADFVKVDENNNSKYFLKDLSTLKQAYELLKNNEIKQANELLDSIDSNSVFYKFAKNLKHYQGK